TESWTITEASENKLLKEKEQF
ncbi:MAG: hypothetical protein RL224_1120, partial [Actinomycetota bacterium]